MDLYRLDWQLAMSAFGRKAVGVMDQNKTDTLLLNILHLFTHLLDKHLQFHGRFCRLGIRRL